MKMLLVSGKGFAFNPQLFAELEAAGATVQVVDGPGATGDVVPSLDAVAPVQSDIDSMKAAIDQFGAAGAKLFPDELAAMKQKLADMEAKAAAEIEEVKEKEATWAEDFRAKHGVSWQIAFLGGAYVMWQVGAAVGHVLGVL